MLIPSGIEELDRIIAGGLKTNYCYAIKGAAGVGKTVLSLFIAKGALEQGISVVYITTEVTVEEIIDYANQFAIDFQHYIDSNQLKIAEIKLSPQGQITLQGPHFDLSGIIERTKYYINQYNAKAVIFDSISAFLSEFKHEDYVRSKFVDFIETIKQEGVALILVIEESEHTSKGSVEDYVVEGIISIEQSWEGKTLNKVIRVPKLRGARQEPFESVLVISDQKLKIILPEQKPLVQIEGASTGIQKLDTLLGGGIPNGSMVLIETTGETNYLPLVVSTLAHYLEENKGIIVHSNVQMYPQRIIELLEETNFAIEKYVERGNIVFIDKYNRSVTAIEAKEIQDLFDIEHMISITGEMVDAFKSNSQDVVIYGDLTDDANILSEKDFLKYFALQSFYIKERGALGYAVINSNAVSGETLARLRTTADVILKFVSKNNILRFECTKNVNGATFLPKIVQVTNELPMLKFLE